MFGRSKAKARVNAGFWISVQQDPDQNKLVPPQLVSTVCADHPVAAM
jgi:hypothetical protein